jgi:hypothetical protein
MGTHHRYRRSDLFLVRLWTEDADDDGGQVQWRGKVQRVVDGEAHQFSDWQGLSELLMAMLSAEGSTSHLAQSGPGEHTDSERSEQ